MMNKTELILECYGDKYSPPIVRLSLMATQSFIYLLMMAFTLRKLNVYVKSLNRHLFYSWAVEALVAQVPFTLRYLGSDKEIYANIMKELITSVNSTVLMLILFRLKCYQIYFSEELSTTN